MHQETALTVDSNWDESVGDNLNFDFLWRDYCPAEIDIRLLHLQNRKRENPVTTFT